MKLTGFILSRIELGLFSQQENRVINLFARGEHLIYGDFEISARAVFVRDRLRRGKASDRKDAFPDVEGAHLLVQKIRQSVNHTVSEFNFSV